MENQPLPDSGNSTTQPPAPQQIGEISPTQPAVGTSYQPTAAVPEQQPAALYPPSAPDTTQPTVVMGAAQPTSVASPVVDEPQRKSPLKLILIALFVLFVLAAGGYLLVTHNPKAAKVIYDHPRQGSQPSSATTTSTTSSLAGEKNIVFGSTATDGTFQVKLLGVTPKPVVTGDQPDAGTEYMEADFSVTSIANKNNYAFTMLYAPSIVPAGDKLGDIELNPIDSTDGTTSPISFSHISAKTVQVAGKNSVEGYTIPSDGSAKTVTVYALFEIKSGDTGQIVWQGLDGGNYHFLTQ